MTMPHLMNCEHSPDGWCLKCVEKLHQESEKYRMALEGLTVGGSEFYRNPELCVKHIKDRMSARFELMKKLKDLNEKLKEKDLELNCFNERLREATGIGQGEIDSHMANCLEIGLSHNLFAILKPKIEEVIELLPDLNSCGDVDDVQDLILDLKLSVEMIDQRLKISKDNPSITADICHLCEGRGQYLADDSSWVSCPCKDNDPHNYRDDNG